MNAAVDAGLVDPQVVLIEARRHGTTGGNGYDTTLPIGAWSRYDWSSAIPWCRRTRPIAGIGPRRGCRPDGRRMHPADGQQTCSAGDAFYWAAGHAQEAIIHCERIDFSPTEEIKPVLKHITGG
jgi:hypothetical protein